MYKLDNVIFDNGKYWVLRIKDGYEVYETGITCSRRCAQIGWTGEKGEVKAINEAKKRSLAISESDLAILESTVRLFNADLAELKLIYKCAIEAGLPVIIAINHAVVYRTFDNLLKVLYSSPHIAPNLKRRRDEVIKNAYLALDAYTKPAK